MEQIIAAGITAIVTLVVALVAVGLALKILGKDVESHAENLSRDHHDLDSSIKEAKEATRGDIAELADMTAYLRDEQMKAEARREALKEQSLDVQKAVDLLTALADRVVSLEQENIALREENRRLRTELAHPPKKKSRNGQNGHPR